jgi:hypothetical protein
MVMDRFFCSGNPGVLFKRPANIYNFHDTIMALVVFCAEQVTKSGAHLSLTYRDDFEDVSPVDKLAVKIRQEEQEHKLQEEASKQEETTMKRKKKKASDFLAPPPASLLELRSFSSITKPFGYHRKSNEPMTVSNSKPKAHNNSQKNTINVDEDGKENICHLSIKKHHTTIAGTDLFSMFTSAMNNVDPTTGTIAKMMEQRTQFMQLAEQHHLDTEEHAHHAEEGLQHLQLLQMLHSGKIDQATYDALKP